MLRRFLIAIFGRTRDTRPFWYAVKLSRREDALDRGWLVKTTPAEYSADFGASAWYDTPAEAQKALELAGLLVADHQLVRLGIRVDTNHYSMKDIAWPY